MGWLAEVSERKIRIGRELPIDKQPLTQVNKKRLQIDFAAFDF